MFPQERLFTLRPELLKVMARAEDDLLGVKNLARGIRRTMLGAAPAFHAGECLQACDPRQVFARVEPEIFISDQRRNLAEPRPLQKHGDRAQHQVHVLGARNQRQKK